MYLQRAADEAPGRLSLVERQASAVLRALPIKHGKHRILDRVLPRPRHRRQQRVSVPFANSRLNIDVGNLVGWHFAILRDFDPEVAEVLIAAADDAGADVFWDIGANQGTCSYLVATALRQACVVAIEPQQGLIEDLTSNLRRLADGRFEVHAVGIGTERGVVQLTVPEGNDGAATLHAGERGVTGRVENVTITPAEDLVHKSAYGWPTLVKMDVEGHEASVFASLLPAIQQQLCRAIVFENHAGEAETFAKIRGIADACDYRLYAITKTPFRTTLVSTAVPVPGVTDYAMVLRSHTAIPALARLMG
jgi:FkbM family methyltransferase